MSDPMDALRGVAISISDRASYMANERSLRRGAAFRKRKAKQLLALRRTLPSRKSRLQELSRREAFWTKRERRSAHRQLQLEFINRELVLGRTRRFGSLVTSVRLKPTLDLD